MEGLHAVVPGAEPVGTALQWETSGCANRCEKNNKNQQKVIKVIKVIKELNRILSQSTAQLSML